MPAKRRPQNWQSNSDVISRLAEQFAARLRGNLALHLLEAVDTGAAIRAAAKQLSPIGPWDAKRSAPLRRPKWASCWPSSIPSVPELDLKKWSKGWPGPCVPMLNLQPAGPAVDFAGGLCSPRSDRLPRHIRARRSPCKEGTSAARQALARGQISGGGRSTPAPPMHRAPPLGTIDARPWSSR
jgi:hypothetical protein